MDGNVCAFIQTALAALGMARPVWALETCRLHCRHRDPAPGRGLTLLAWRVLGGLVGVPNAGRKRTRPAFATASGSSTRASDSCCAVLEPNPRHKRHSKERSKWEDKPRGRTIAFPADGRSE